MAKERFDVGKAPAILIESCPGDLVIHSWAEPGVMAIGEFEVKETEMGLAFFCRGEMRLNVPAGAQLHIGDVSGDLALRHVTGDADVEKVDGDAILVDVGLVKIGTIHGDMSLKHASGAVNVSTVHGDMVGRHLADLSVDVVYGDCAIRHVAGSVVVGEVSGDADLQSVGGDVEVKESRRDVNLSAVGGSVNVANALGDIRLRGKLGPGEHTLNASGDIVVRWPANEPVNLTVVAPQIANRLNLEDAVEKDGALTGRIGDGKTSLNLSAGGRVVLKEAEMTDEKWGNFGGQFGTDINVELEGLGERIRAEIGQHLERLNQEFETNFGPAFAQKMTEKMARKAEQAAARAERAGERARRRAERGGPPPVVFSGAPTPPPSARKQASFEEQLKILQMVEKGAISPEEADLLLKALED